MDTKSRADAGNLAGQRAERLPPGAQPESLGGEGRQGGQGWLSLFSGLGVGCRKQCKQKSPRGWDRHRAGTGTGLGRYRQDLGSRL